MAEADDQGKITRYFIHGLGLLAMMTPDYELYTYHYDGNGNTIAMTDSSKEVVNSYAYTPYGLIANQDETIEQPFTFAGMVGIMEEVEGLYYMRARYYDPSVGRFISEDPIGFAGGDVNLYAYVGGSPMMFMDPFGLSAESEYWGDFQTAFWNNLYQNPPALGGSVTVAGMQTSVTTGGVNLGFTSTLGGLSFDIHSSVPQEGWSWGIGGRHLGVSLSQNGAVSVHFGISEDILLGRFGHVSYNYFYEEY